MNDFKHSSNLNATTIAAVASPFGEGAIALLRISGPRALEVAARVCKIQTKAGHKPNLCDLKTRYCYRAEFWSPAAPTHPNQGHKIDEGLVTFFRAPASYTGEDLVELTCHGGILVTRRLLEAILAAGAESAQPGEFTQRAFLNGKMDLTQAEAVMDVIQAQTDLALRSAEEQLAGRLGQQIETLREDLITLVAHLEAYIDFPEEDINPDTGKQLCAHIDRILAPMETLLSTADQGRLLREGVRTVIYGNPNVGKSSLLNALLGQERAIVSAQPGTTRDTIEERIQIKGIPLRLIDTAGLRDTQDQIEQAGIERTKNSLTQADLNLHVVDAHEPMPPNFALHSKTPTLLILNKVDLGIHPEWQKQLPSTYQATIPLSCKNYQGITQLCDAIFECITSGKVTWNEAAVAINARHQACLQKAKQFLINARNLLEQAEAPEFIALDLRGALDAVGEIIGGTDTETILGKIFSSFCIGK